MAQGKVSYGSKFGRPTKKKYDNGGKLSRAMKGINLGKVGLGGGSVLDQIRDKMASDNVDPFSTKNPEGVPAEQVAEAMENQNMANEGLPTSNAMDRSQVAPIGNEVGTGMYKEGGKVDVTDVVKTVSEVEQSKKHSKKRESLQKKHPGVDPNIEGLRAVPEWYKGSSEEWRKGLGKYKKAETKRLKKKILKG